MLFAGLDIPKHGEPAYPPEAYGNGYQEKILTVLENGQLSSYQLSKGNFNIIYFFFLIRGVNPVEKVFFFFLCPALSLQNGTL